MPKKSRLGLILLAVAVLGWFVVVRGQAAVFADRALQAKVLSVEVNSYDQRLKDIADINKEGSAVQDTLKSMYLAMPRTSQVPEALVMIESLAGSSGVALSSATIGSPADSQLPVTLGFGGDANSISKFLDAVNSNVRTGIIKSQSISADGSGTLSVTIQMGLVYQGGKL